MENVDLIASGYEWDCPECGSRNEEVSAIGIVQCDSCDNQFEVGSVNHAGE